MQGRVGCGRRPGRLRQGPPPGGRGNCAPRAPPAQDAPARLQACGPGRVASEPCRPRQQGSCILPRHGGPARRPAHAPLPPYPLTIPDGPGGCARARSCPVAWRTSPGRGPRLGRRGGRPRRPEPARLALRGPLLRQARRVAAANRVASSTVVHFSTGNCGRFVGGGRARRQPWPGTADTPAFRPPARAAPRRPLDDGLLVEHSAPRRNNDGTAMRFCHCRVRKG